MLFGLVVSFDNREKPFRNCLYSNTLVVSICFKDVTPKCCLLQTNSSCWQLHAKVKYLSVSFHGSTKVLSTSQGQKRNMIYILLMNTFFIKKKLNLICMISSHPCYWTEFKGKEVENSAPEKITFTILWEKSPGSGSVTVLTGKALDKPISSRHRQLWPIRNISTEKFLHLNDF